MSGAWDDLGGRRDPDEDPPPPPTPIHTGRISRRAREQAAAGIAEARAALARARERVAGSAREGNSTEVHAP